MELLENQVSFLKAKKLNVSVLFWSLLWPLSGSSWSLLWKPTDLSCQYIHW